ncbi:hypothetical protein NQ314_006506 [Rhamnusium bicolor]|uniref:Uncharacterized protein n=1 Tax=Rhamnusium bicolor TaxID=1586634 RepID=A0AAV8Z3D1_9CUCU|nr:hypothetical protein NQ314_006506 [Rhamnusium bicolor]
MPSFAPRIDGPYLTHKEVTPTNYKVTSLADPDSPLGKYHISALTPYRETNQYDLPVRLLRQRGRPPLQPIKNNCPVASSSNNIDEQ